MNIKSRSALIVAIAITFFVAMSIAVTLMEQFSDSITYIDLAALFILGIIAGLFLDRLLQGKKKMISGAGTHR